MVTFILLRWYSLKCDRRKVNFKFRKTYIIFGIVIDHISEKVFGSFRITVIPHQGDLPRSAF
ncbi:unnamed protein product [Musa banksii]